MTPKSYEEISSFMSEHLDEAAWHAYLHAEDISPATLRYIEEAFCVECMGLYPRTADHWPIQRTHPFTLGRGICLYCLETILEGSNNVP